MRKTRHVIAIALVTAALCADRAAIAAPAVTAPVAGIAVRWANRLTGSFNRGATHLVLHTPRFAGVDVSPRRPMAQPVVAIAPVAFSPFQFRLPPPVL